MPRFLCRNLPEPVMEDLAKRNRRCPDPVAAQYASSAHFGAITERLDRLIEDYLKVRRIISFGKNSDIT